MKRLREEPGPVHLVDGESERPGSRFQKSRTRWAQKGPELGPRPVLVEAREKRVPGVGEVRKKAKAVGREVRAEELRGGGFSSAGNSILASELIRIRPGIRGAGNLRSQAPTLRSRLKHAALKRLESRRICARVLWHTRHVSGPEHVRLAGFAVLSAPGARLGHLREHLRDPVQQLARAQDPGNRCAVLEGLAEVLSEGSGARHALHVQIALQIEPREGSGFRAEGPGAAGEVDEGVENGLDAEVLGLEYGFFDVSEDLRIATPAAERVGDSEIPNGRQARERPERASDFRARSELCLRLDLIKEPEKSA